MDAEFIDLTAENIADEHLCCIIRMKKPHTGVEAKREWLAARLPEGHVFRKLNTGDCVFIEYAPLETAWVPVVGENYLYIYCLWVLGAPRADGALHRRRKGKGQVRRMHARREEAEVVTLGSELRKEVRLHDGRQHRRRVRAAGAVVRRERPALCGERRAAADGRAGAAGVLRSSVSIHPAARGKAARILRGARHPRRV